MVGAGRLERRVGLRGLFAGSVLLYVVSLLLWSVLDSPAAIIASRVVSGAGYAGLWISCVMTIQRTLPPRLQGSGQALISITTVGVAGFVANVAGGLVYASRGPAVLFGASAVLAIVGAMVAWGALPDDAGRTRLPAT
jgi:PPP family 3-phenylpropionic acid transporter